MKRGFKAWAVLAAVAAASAGPAAFANCLNLGGFDQKQCEVGAYFDGPPVGSGTVSAVYWQLGYGNGVSSTALGTTGTGMGGGVFNGNDNGTHSPDLLNARIAIGDANVPATALCLGGLNNLGNAGNDGCVDNPRDPNYPFSDDDILNPKYNVFAVRSLGAMPAAVSPDYGWEQDSPIAVLLRESNNLYFAFAAVATAERPPLPLTHPGVYRWSDVNNGGTNAHDAASNVIDWQLIPGAKVPGDANTGLIREFFPPTGTTGTDRDALLVWTDIQVRSDNSVRSSTHPTVAPNGMGTSDARGPFVRYVLENQAPANPNNPVGSLDPNGWTAMATFFPPDSAAVVTIPADRCIRMHTYFGLEPLTMVQTTDNCRLGLCGDLGYDVTSPASCLAGALISESPTNVKAQREKTGSVTITWSALELSTTSYDINGVSKRGATKLGSVPAKGSGSGTTESYKFTVSAAGLRGTRTIEIVAQPSGAKQRVPIK